MTVRTLATEIWLPQPIERVFAFFSDVHNLEVLTPPWLHFRILTPGTVSIAANTQIEYRIRWRAVPIKWRTRISVWEPPFRFVDQQESGPYRQWIHEHTFATHEGGTLMRDRVEYVVPGWFLEPLLTRFVVAPDVHRIFDYRHRKMLELFGSSASIAV